MPKRARDVASGLQKKGFVAEHNDHVFYTLYVNGVKTAVYTKISHGEKEIVDPLLGVMARQLKIIKSQLVNLIECPLTQPEFLKILRAGGHIQ